MKEAKRKEIEARLCQLISETNLTDTKKPRKKSDTQGASIIRRRKGKPDVRVL